MAVTPVRIVYLTTPHKNKKLDQCTTLPLEGTGSLSLMVEHCITTTTEFLKDETI